MNLDVSPGAHLTYCLNVHPGGTWAEAFAAIRGPALKVRDLVAPNRPFGLGMRLGAVPAAELHRPETLAQFQEFLQQENLFVSTVNGFPYAHFHGGRVKEDVYVPDWRTQERLDYTMQLADIMAALVPEGGLGTISTVPGSWKAWIKSDDDVRAMRDRLLACADYLAGLRETRGREIVLTLEPEPGCYLETTNETIGFFRSQLFGRNEAAARHLGVCFDTCHVALQFEDLADSLRTYEAAGIRVPKIQISSALRTDASAEALKALQPFAEPVYLHQTKALSQTGEKMSWTDLPEALVDLKSIGAQEVRVHFHVPLHFEAAGPLASTAPSMTPDFFALLQSGRFPHLEIETYTWEVLPEKLREGSLEESVAREFAWVRKHL